MVDASKQTSVAAIASDLGAAMAHTPTSPGTGGCAGEADALGDLFAAIDEETSGYDEATIQPMKRGRGRPPGSVSRTTRQLQAYLQSRGYRDPAEFLASIVSMSTGELRTALGSKAADGPEVLKVQIRAAEALMPYFHQRLPQQVEVKSDAARPLIMIMGYDGPAAIGGGDGSMSVLDLVADQGVSDAAPDRSHD